MPDESNRFNIKIYQYVGIASQIHKTEPTPNSEQLQMMETFTCMVNDYIKIGLKNDCTTLKKLSLLSYHKLDKYNMMSYYKLNAISQAAGRLQQRKRSLKRGINTRQPFVQKPFLVNCYGFKINGCLLSMPYKQRQPIHILLNEHTQKVLADPTLKVESFSMSWNGLSFCISKQVHPIIPQSIIGIDRNLRNVTVGNNDKVLFFKTNKLLSIKENTIHARSGFKRNDYRVKRKFFQKFNQRMQHRTKKLIHRISKQIVEKAKQSESAIVFENLKGIRKLYRKGNGQGNKYRRMMNGWQTYELQRQIQYKAEWEGLHVLYVDPKRTSTLCPVCGKRIQEDRQNRRKLWCNNCMKSMDRDVVASLNIAYKGWARFTHPRGDTHEAQSGTFEPAISEPKSSNYDDLAIRIVDVSKGERW
jgi:putative transposase